MKNRSSKIRKAAVATISGSIFALSLSATALADETPTPAAPTPAAPAPAAPAPAAPTPAPAAPTPAAPAAAAPAPAAGPSCTLDRFVGVTEEEAQAIDDVVCGPIRSGGMTQRGQFHLRVVKVGAKIVVTLVAPMGGEKQVVLTDIGEVTVAAPRLHEAALEQKPVEETLTMQNVVGDEARKPKRKVGEVHFLLGVIGATAVGSGAGAGANMALAVGNDRWTFIGDLRLASEAVTKPSTLSSASTTSTGTSRGVGSIKESGFTFVSLAGGVRHSLSSADFAPFVGAGLGIDYVAIPSQDEGTKSAKTGLAAYGEVGIDILRAHTVGGSIVLRADAPTFSVEEKTRSESDPTKITTTSSYTPVLSAGIALRF